MKRLIFSQIRQLESVDLMKKYDKWRKTVTAIREIVLQVEQRGFSNTHAWKSDIDNTLCKIFEKQYLKCLETIYTYLPEIHTNLVYRNAELQFAPDEEVLKKKYEYNLKKLIDIPKHFDGVADTREENIFAKVLERSVVRF